MGEHDYELLCKWWRGHGFPCPPLSFLPAAYVLERHAAGFLYAAAPMPVGWLEWLVTDPDATPLAAGVSLLTVIRKLESLAQEQGVKWLFTAVSNSGLERVFVANRWTVGDRNITQLVKCLS